MSTEGQDMEFIRSDDIPSMTVGKQYHIWCSNDAYVVVMDNRGQWRMFPNSWFAAPPMLTDNGALEYEEIMASLGGA